MKARPCDHKTVQPTFDEAASRALSCAEVRRRWPRFFGTCPDCGVRICLYASLAHYVSGDW